MEVKTNQGLAILMERFHPTDYKKLKTHHENDVVLMDHEDCQERHDMKTTEALIRQTGGRRQQDLEKLGEAAGELAEHQENAMRGHS